jgi:tetratricopeptide (TPR) repeat protein
LKEKKNNTNTLSKSKQLFFIVFTIIFPLTALCILEIGLRVFHYGPNLSLFTIENIHGKTYYTMNPDIKYRYFSQVEFSPITSPEYFLTTKSNDTYRIFCLGASTTVGYPYWYNAAFSSFLRNRLHSQFPNKQCEIINLGLTATNSYTTVDIARELVDYQPDLLIVYDGHNEFYGALGIASRETLGSSRWIAHAYLRLIRVRTFQLLRNIVSQITSLVSPPTPTEGRGTMMERLSRGKYIPYASPTYNDALLIFKENLNDIQSICADHKIPIMFSSQVSNLRGQRPFISGDYPGSSAIVQQLYHDNFEKGIDLLNANKIDSSLMIFQNLYSFDTLRADVHYFLGRCYEKKKNNFEALKEYTKARDYDQLRFRASSDLNNLLRQSCTRENEIFVDIEQLFKEHSRDSLIGNELIVEHLHPNAWGYFLMAQEYARVMRRHHLYATTEEWNSSASVDENELWKQRPVTEIDERLAKRKTEILTASWPFTQLTAPKVTSITSDDTLGAIVETVMHGQWNWIDGHQQAAKYYLQRGERENAAKEFETIINQIPNEVNPYLQLAHIYLETGELEKVKKVLVSSLGVEKTILAYRALGDIALKQNEPLKAISYYEGTTMFSQSLHEKLQNGYLLAFAQYQAGKSELARNQLLLLLQLKPDFSPAQELLAKLSTK